MTIKKIKTIGWVLVGTREQLLKAQQALQPRIDLERVETATWLSFPGGVEQKTIEYHRLGDYFNDITLELEHDLIITFHVKEKAGRFWKDLGVEIVLSALEIDGIKSMGTCNKSLYE